MTILSRDRPTEVKIGTLVVTVEQLLREVANRVRLGDEGRVHIDRIKHTYGDGLSVRATLPGGGGASIGTVFLLPSGDNTTLLRVPSDCAFYELDGDGQYLSNYLQEVFTELEQRGLIPAKSHLKSADALDTVKKRLAHAENAQDYENIGNSCLAVLIALADELWQPHMRPTDSDPPKGDDAKTKLGLIARSYISESRQYGAFMKVIAGAWDFAQPLKHRKNAAKNDAEVCVILTTAVFDSFALIAANG